MNLIGIGWNDSEKMLVLEDETYRAYVKVYEWNLFILFLKFLFICFYVQ